MTEHFTWGIVLKKEAIGEADNEYSIFTWDVGKILARAQGSRKILSRLAGHLEPGTLSTMRIIRKNEGGKFRIAEALREERNKSALAIKMLLLTENLTPLEQPDINIFSFLKSIIIKNNESEAKLYAQLLKLAGFDPKRAKCEACDASEIAYFLPQDIIFLCTPCLKRRTNKIKNI